jgi:hypothetical protein
MIIRDYVPTETLTMPFRRDCYIRWCTFLSSLYLFVDTDFVVMGLQDIEGFRPIPHTFAYVAPHKRNRL